MGNEIDSLDEILNRLTRVFREDGYEAASLARLSKATGLGRSSLYHYFPGGKSEMALAVVERSNKLFAEKVIEPLRRNVAPKERLVEMVRNLEGYYARGTESCLLGVFAMSGAPNPLRDHIRVGLSDWIDALACALTDAGLSRAVARDRAEEAVCRIEGALVVARDRRPSAFHAYTESAEDRLACARPRDA
ncbi:TetR/AcrR family transcriptional regulator [Polaromonas sp. P1-6]|nr:TetR/AcrR family transcriptional regulator [Polaromonas sp. P1-6]